MKLLSEFFASQGRSFADIRLPRILDLPSARIAMLTNAGIRNHSIGKANSLWLFVVNKKDVAIGVSD